MSWIIDEDTEAAHLADITTDDLIESWDEDWDEEWDEEHEVTVKRHKEKILDEILNNEERYRQNKKAKVGTQIKCTGPLCGKKFKKKQYAQCFCSNHCKDQFWNRRQAFFGFRKKIDIIN